MGAIAFFDLPGSTKMMKSDPHMAVPRMILHNAMCRAIIRLNKGTIVKELGDGLMVRFDNAGYAIRCAVRVIKNLQDHGGGVCTKVTVAFGTIWDVRNSSGEPDVYGTPVLVCAGRAFCRRLPARRLCGHWMRVPVCAPSSSARRHGQGKGGCPLRATC